VPHYRNRRSSQKSSTPAFLTRSSGNSLAQAEWAIPHLGDLVTPKVLERNVDSTEARVFQAYWRGDFREVVDQCEPWRLEEPYSSRPALFGSGAAIAIEDFQSALRFCDEGLKKNPHQVVLKNNRAYVLVATGRFDEGSHLIASLTFRGTLAAKRSPARSVANAGPCPCRRRRGLLGWS
jgi:hypothetical protein